MSFFKNVVVTENKGNFQRDTLQFRAEFFNIFNGRSSGRSQG